MTILLIVTLLAAVVTITNGASANREGSGYVLGPNLLTGDAASFESSVGAWRPQGNTTVSHEQTLAYEGSGSLRVLVDKKGPWPDRTKLARVGTPWSKEAVPTTAGTQLYGSAWVRSEKAAPVRCEIRWFDDKGKILSTLEPPFVGQAARVWTEQTCVGVAPARTAYANLRVVRADAEYTDLFHVDSARLSVVLGTEEPTTTTAAPTTTTAAPTTTTTAPSGPTLGANLLVGARADFEGSDGGWTPEGNTTLSHSTQTARSGNGSLRVLVDQSGPWPDSTKTARAGTPWGTNGQPVTPGTTYYGSMWVNPAAAASPARCEVRYFTSSGSIASTVAGSYVTTSAGQWSKLECQAVAPSNAAYANLRVFVSQAEYGDVHFVDDAYFGEVLTSSAPAAPETTTTTAAPAPEPTTTTVAPAPQTTTTTAAPAPSSGWPGAGNTGVPAGVSLTASGSIATSYDGQVIQNLEVTGIISVRHKNVVIRNVRVLATSRYGVEIPISLDGSASFTMEDSEVIGVSGERSAGIVHYGSWTVRRVEIRGFMDAVKVKSNQQLLDSWIVDDYYKPSGSHNDGVQSVAGRNVLIRGNRIEGPWKSQTSALIFSADIGTIDGYTIEGNLLSGGGYTAYSRSNSYAAPTNMVFRNNVFVRNSWQYGPLSVNTGAGWVWENNRYDDGTLM